MNNTMKQEDSTKIIDELLNHYKEYLSTHTFEESLQMLIHHSYKTKLAETMSPDKGPIYMIETSSMSECVLLYEVWRLRKIIDQAQNEEHFNKFNT